MMNFMVLIESWGVFVKSRSFFVAQGGLEKPWGRHWRPVKASSIEAARNKGKRMVRIQAGKRIQFDGGADFS